MNRRAAGLLFLPFLLLFLMTLNARSDLRIAESAKATASEKRAAQSALAGKSTAEQEKWAETTLRQMSVEKGRQVLFTTYHGSFTPTDFRSVRADDARRERVARRRIHQHHARDRRWAS